MRSGAVVVAACLLLAGCASASSQGPATHTKATMMEALKPLEEDGYQCADKSPEGTLYDLGIVCRTSGSPTFDSLNQTISVVLDDLNIEKTKSIYADAHESRCSTEVRPDMTVSARDLFEGNSVVIGQNWFLLDPLEKEANAKRVAELTGGIVLPFTSWCDSPPPLRDIGVQ